MFKGPEDREVTAGLAWNKRHSEGAAVCENAKEKTDEQNHRGLSLTSHLVTVS